MAALKHFYRDLGDRLWGPYGFRDAFNISENWFARTYLALPGADCGDDREREKWRDLESVHVQPGDAAGAR